MLYRAVAYIVGSLDDTECVVFFQAANERSRWAVLSGLLSQAWGVPLSSVEAYNISSERELLDEAFGDSGTGDARLFETGVSYGRATYAQPHRTLMFVRPSTLERLHAGQQLATVLDLQRQVSERQRGLTTVAPMLPVPEVCELAVGEVPA